MLEEPTHRYLARLLLTFSDLCNSDSEIAECLTLMRLAPPLGESKWTAENVRKLMPQAYSTVCSNSPYTVNESTQTLALCKAIYQFFNSKKETKK